MADDSNSVLPPSASLPAQTQAEELYEVPVADPSSTVTSAFDYSYLLVLGLGLAGLFWIRRQTHAL
jgi:hypothetical protein